MAKSKAVKVSHNGEVTVIDKARAKTACPIDRATFRNEAGPVKVVVKIGDAQIPLTVDPKEFSTGSLGWFMSGKVDLEVDGVSVKCQGQIQFTIVNSKELPPIDDDSDE